MEQDFVLTVLMHPYAAPPDGQPREGLEMLQRLINLLAIVASTAGTSTKYVEVVDISNWLTKGQWNLWNRDPYTFGGPYASYLVPEFLAGRFVIRRLAC